jgi:hypothetical protein
LYYLLGIDDTNAPNSADTSALAYTLGRKLESLSLARLVNISCHQLFQHPSIPHTTHNSACCLLLDAEEIKTREIDLLCRQTLHSQSAPASNPGFALAAWNHFNPEVITWGKNAKQIPLDRQDGVTLARRCGISTAGIFGSGTGVIGALAAVGLRYEGSDGWITWMPGLLGLQGVFTQAQLSQTIRFDLIETEAHKHPAMDDRICINANPRPHLKNGKIALTIVPSKRGSEFDWQA